MLIADIKLYGNKEIEAGLKKIAVTSMAGLNMVVKSTCLNIERLAKTKAPVDTGRLKTSITHSVVQESKNSLYGTVGTNVSYAIHQEFGTRPHLAPVGEGWAKRHGLPGAEYIMVSGKAHPFLIPAFYESKEFFIRQIQNVLKKLKLT